MDPDFTLKLGKNGSLEYFCHQSAAHIICNRLSRYLVETVGLTVEEFVEFGRDLDLYYIEVARHVLKNSKKLLQKSLWVDILLRDGRHFRIWYDESKGPEFEAGGPPELVIPFMQVIDEPLKALLRSQRLEEIFERNEQEMEDFRGRQVGIKRQFIQMQNQFENIPSTLAQVQDTLHNFDKDINLIYNGLESSRQKLEDFQQEDLRQSIYSAGTRQEVKELKANLLNEKQEIRGDIRQVGDIIVQNVEANYDRIEERINDLIEEETQGLDVEKQRLQIEKQGIAVEILKAREEHRHYAANEEEERRHNAAMEEEARRHNDIIEEEKNNLCLRYK